MLARSIFSLPKFRLVRQVLIGSLIVSIFLILVFDYQRIRWRDSHSYVDGEFPPWTIFSYSKKPIRGGTNLKPLGSSCQLMGPLDPHDPLYLIKKVRGSISSNVISSRHAIVLDAGSTGSRIHIYEFQYCGDRLIALSDEVFDEVKPGLSHYYQSPADAARSLTPLLLTALERVPSFLYKCTPLTLKATAGLRLLPEESVKAILASVREWLREHPFIIGDGHEDMVSEYVGVMDGSEEAILAWVTVNFLQKMIGLDPSIEEGQNATTNSTNHFPSTCPIENTSIVMDLGGGSTQIVFAIPDTTHPSSDPKRYPEYYYQLHFQQKTHHLYQHSYLGFGLMEGRKQIKRNFVENYRKYNNAGSTAIVDFPCYPLGHSEKFEGITFKGSSNGWNACLEIIKPIFKKDEPCLNPPCAFNGVHQPLFSSKNSWNPKYHKGSPSIFTNSTGPSVEATKFFEQKRSIVAFSYIYDRIIPLGLTSPITLEQVAKAGQQLCAASMPINSQSSITKSVSWNNSTESSVQYEKLLGQLPEWCLDLAYIYTLLSYGYEIELDQLITITKQVNGYEAGWTLGSALKLLEKSAAISCPIPPPRLA